MEKLTDWSSSISDRVAQQHQHHQQHQAAHQSSAGSHTLPVFVFPSSLTFFADDSSSYKQILTLYNPYDFAVRFKVLSTAPQKYVVVDPEGHIRARCYVDIVIRINDVSPKHHNRSDEFRIWMYQQTGSGIESLIRSSTLKLTASSHVVSGHRDITAILLPVRPAATQASGMDGKSFESIPGSSSNLTQSQIFTSTLTSGTTRQMHNNNNNTTGSNSHNNRSPAYFLILISVAAAVVLMMPNSDEERPSLLSFLPIPGLHMKLCAAYVLGCITKPLFWP